MGEAGFPARTFNLSVNGMDPPEDGYVLERVLGAKPRHLKWVFIELEELHTRRIPEAEGTRRSLYWHDGKRTLLVLRAIVDASHQDGGFTVLKKISGLFLPGSGSREARDLLFFHGTLFAKQFTNIERKGDFFRWLSHLRKEEPLTETLGGNGDGYVPLSRTMSEAEVAAYEAELDYAVTHSGSRFSSLRL